MPVGLIMDRWKNGNLALHWVTILWQVEYMGVGGWSVLSRSVPEIYW